MQYLLHDLGLTVNVRFRNALLEEELKHYKTYLKETVVQYKKQVN
jgi:hypothetical protein